MTSFIDIPFESDPTSRADDATDYIVAHVEGYTPSPGNLEVITIEALAPMAADLCAIAAQVPSAVIRAFGTKLVGVPYEAGSPAQASVTFTMADTAAHTIPAGLQLTIAGLAFALVADVVVPAGTGSAVGIVAAAEDGVAYNGVSEPAESVDALDWLAAITVTGATSGGLDAEDDQLYQNRLAAALTLQAPRPITADDYAVMALSFVPAPGSDQQEIGRATAIDGYDPAGGGTYDQPRTVCVFVTLADGTAPNGDTLTALATWLAAHREVNFIVHVVAATYTTVYVTFAIHPYPAFDAASVAASAQAAVLDYLNPATFGLPRYGETAAWLNDTKVRLFRLVGVIEQVQGVDYVTSIELGTAPSPSGTVDVTLPGPAPLPLATTVSVPLPSIA